MNYGAVDALRFPDCYALLWLGISAFYLYLLQLLQLWAEQYVVQLSGILSLLQTEKSVFDQNVTTLSAVCYAYHPV